MKILGGMSGPGTITIYSDGFTSTANFKQNPAQQQVGEWEIWSTVTEVSPKVSKIRNIVFPKTASIFISIWQSLGWYMRAFMLAVIILGCRSPEPVSSTPWYIHAYFLSYFALMAWFVKKYIGPWHAAEHMAIASFERCGSCEIPEIRKEEPIHRKCGGRFLFPFALVSFLGYMLTAHGVMHWHPMVVHIILIEIALWIDYFIGFDSIWGFSHVSVWLQRYVTTTKPGMAHLDTASFALQELIRAHHPGPVLDIDVKIVDY